MFCFNKDIIKNHKIKHLKNKQSEIISLMFSVNLKFLQNIFTYYVVNFDHTFHMHFLHNF